jgi:hypothetical protein
MIFFIRNKENKAKNINGISDITLSLRLKNHVLKPTAETNSRDSVLWSVSLKR